MKSAYEINRALIIRVFLSMFSSHQLPLELHRVFAWCLLVPLPEHLFRMIRTCIFQMHLQIQCDSFQSVMENGIIQEMMGPKTYFALVFMQSI